MLSRSYGICFTNRKMQGINKLNLCIQIRVDVSHNVGGFFNLAVAHFSGLTNQKSSFYMTLAIILFFPGV